MLRDGDGRSRKAGLARRRPGVRATGFTLIEVLVVAAIIALLIAILLPVLRKARLRAQTAVCLSNLRSIGSATTMYMADNKDWLPVGPPDKTFWYYYDDEERKPYYFREPTPWADIRPWSNCHWGGKRAGLIHVWEPHNENVAPEPEKHTRPLTRYLYPKSSLDNDMPLFHCPGDKELSQNMYEKFVYHASQTKYGYLVGDVRKNMSLYEACGNSYYNNPWYGSPFGRRKRALVTSQVVLFEDGVFSVDGNGVGNGKEGTYVPPIQSHGWHGSFIKYNMLFLDFHAAFMNADPQKRNGPGWVVESYFDIMDYYY